MTAPAVGKWQAVLDKDDSAEWLETCAAAMEEIRYADRIKIANSFAAIAIKTADTIGPQGVALVTALAESLIQWADMGVE